MSKDQINLNSASTNHNVSGFKVIEVNITDNSSNLYAVVTPVKMKD
ncbi:hypothetical protein ACFSCX_12325 [Bacillus salitolerans]|uniref:Uncharacterized protein n=1 Tax=Bacillus salitolerans TaxID=1437434 RepID=A0ABW4LQI2_9BACI